MFEPQRHRGTEKTQSHPPIHVANTKTQRHEDITKATHRPIQPTDHTDKHRCSHSRLDHVARSWPPNGGQGPLERAPVLIASDRHWGSFQRPAFRERRPRHFSPPFDGWEGHASFPDRREARRNRRAPGASAGRKPGCDERLRSEQSDFLPAGGDRQIAVCSAVNPRHCRITSATNPLCLRVFVFATWARLRRRAATPWQAGGSAPLRLCVSAFLSSVSLWFSQCLGGSPGCVGGKFEIRNSKFEI
jgi:hypothetical protein